MPPQHLAEFLAREGLNKYLWNERTRRSLSPFFKSARGTPTSVYFKWGEGGCKSDFTQAKQPNHFKKLKRDLQFMNISNIPTHIHFFWLSHDIHPTRRAIKSGLFKLKQMDKSQPRRPIHILLNHINQQHGFSTLWPPGQLGMTNVLAHPSVCPGLEKNQPVSVARQHIFPALQTHGQLREARSGPHSSN